MTILNKLQRKVVSTLKSYRYRIEELDCAACAKKIEDRIASEEGYEDVIVNFSTATLSFKTDKTEGIEKELKTIIAAVEPEAILVTSQSKEIEEAQRNNTDILRLLIGVLVYASAVFFQLTGLAMTTAITVSVLILMYKTAIKAGKQLKHKVLDENALIVISVIGACFIGKVSEGIMVITLYEIGKILEARAVNKTRKSIASLMDIKPEYANLKKSEEIEVVSPEEVKVGDTILVKTGEKIPLDGTVVKGESEINNAALTGESKPVAVLVGSKVLSGGVNLGGLIEIKVDKTYENSTVSQILNLVENATDKKAKTETMVSRLAKIYTPIVMGLAVLVAIFMPMLIQGVSYTASLYKALTFLVIACPCSIAISVPLSYFSGIGKASRSGILVKGSDYLDGLKEIQTIIFDKTGTITTGSFRVNTVQVLAEGYTQESILEYFALGESFSNHPIAKSILAKYGKEIDTKAVQNYQEIPGQGIQYTLEEKTIKIGNKNFAGTTALKESKLGTTLYLNINGTVAGSVVLADEVKPEAQEAIQSLNKVGITTKMYTGDSKDIAETIAKEVGITEVKYEMLPQEKYNALEEEISNRIQTNKIAFVGDGINDSPVLVRSDIGVSMGGIGSSSAIEASDVVIMTDELTKIKEGIDISKKTARIIKQNLIFAIGVKILVLILSILGVASMWQAVFADVGTTLITIVNTLRILKNN